MLNDRCSFLNHKLLINPYLIFKRTMSDLVVKASVKESIEEMNVASDFYEALDEEVAELIEDAARRAEENDRKTVQPRDL